MFVFRPDLYQKEILCSLYTACYIYEDTETKDAYSIHYKEKKKRIWMKHWFMQIFASLLSTLLLFLLELSSHQILISISAHWAYDKWLLFSSSIYIPYIYFVLGLGLKCPYFRWFMNYKSATSNVMLTLRWSCCYGHFSSAWKTFYGKALLRKSS